MGPWAAWYLRPTEEWAAGSMKVKEPFSGTQVTKCDTGWFSAVDLQGI